MHMLATRRYHHVDGAIFLSHNRMGLHPRPWHWKYRLNVGCAQNRSPGSNA